MEDLLPLNKQFFFVMDIDNISHTGTYIHIFIYIAYFMTQCVWKIVDIEILRALQCYFPCSGETVCFYKSILIYDFIMLVGFLLLIKNIC